MNIILKIYQITASIKKKQKYIKKLLGEKEKLKEDNELIMTIILDIKKEQARIQKQIDELEEIKRAQAMLKNTFNRVKEKIEVLFFITLIMGLPTYFIFRNMVAIGISSFVVLCTIIDPIITIPSENRSYRKIINAYTENHNIDDIEPTLEQLNDQINNINEQLQLKNDEQHQKIKDINNIDNEIREQQLNINSLEAKRNIINDEIYDRILNRDLFKIKRAKVKKIGSI